MLSLFEVGWAHITNAARHLKICPVDRRDQLSTVLAGICSQQLIPRGKEAGGGRICATELLIANPAVRNCIREGKTNQIKTLIQTGVNVGMHTMEQSLAVFVKNKILSLDAALAYAYDPKDLQRILLEQQGMR